MKTTKESSKEKSGISSLSQSLSRSKSQPRKHDNEEVSITASIRKAEYYHGLIPRVDIEPLLKNEGDFLVRKTEYQGQIVLALSVFHNGHVCHFMINQDTSSKPFYLDNHHEATIDDLVNWHVTTQTPIGDSGCKLITPVERSSWLLTHDSVKLKKKLGEGAFGEVYLADYNGPAGKSEVAIKTMRNEMCRNSRLNFMKEARFMRKFEHKHVVNIFGVAVHENPLMIIMEYCPGGSLLHYLRKNKDNVPNSTRLRFAIEASDGLWYLERQNCVHKDIAARNCLLTSQNLLKISDFGMCDYKDRNHQNIELAPIKWLAIETLENKVYSHKTDVWSYGILVYEIYADGGDLYPGWSNVQTRAKIVAHNYRMEMPKRTPKPVADLVTLCWDKYPEKRPDFGTIYKTLKDYSKKVEAAKTH